MKLSLLVVWHCTRVFVEGTVDKYLRFQSNYMVTHTENGMRYDTFKL
jgi:hypothetical protein